MNGVRRNVGVKTPWENGVDDEQFVERARTHVPVLRQRARECEELRRIPDATMAAFRADGLTRALQPRRFGGLELNPWTFYRAVMEVGAACSSSAWVLGVLGTHAWQLALFPERAQRDVWEGDGEALISSAYAPTGRVERVEGGFRLSGRWPFSSGCDHCNWAFLGGIAPGAENEVDLRTFLVPKSEYKIHDDWRVAGLCGTGSKEIVVESAFVPEHRTHRFKDAFALRNPGQDLNKGLIYRLPFGSVFASVLAAPAIGAAEGALQCYRAQARARLAAAEKAGEDAFIHARLTDAAAELDAARLALERDWRELTALADAGQGVPFAPRVRVRHDAVRAVTRSMNVVDRLFEASGGRSIYLDSPMQRFFRDIHVMRVHAFNNPEKAGRLFGRFDLAEDKNADPGDILI